MVAVGVLHHILVAQEDLHKVDLVVVDHHIQHMSMAVLHQINLVLLVVLEYLVMETQVVLVAAAVLEALDLEILVAMVETLVFQELL